MGNPYAPPGENARPTGAPAGPSGPVGPSGPASAAGPGAPDGSTGTSGPPGAAGPGAAPGGRPVDPDAGPPQGWPTERPGTGSTALDRHGRPGPGRPAREDRPDRPAPDPEVVRASSRRVLHFLALLLAAVVTSALPLPWQAGALVFLVAGIVVGLRALVLAWQGGIRGGLVVMLSVGVVTAGFVGLGMLSLLALWPQQLERQQCLAGAVTISATRQCEADFREAVDERLGGAVRGTTGA